MNPLRERAERLRGMASRLDPGPGDRRALMDAAFGHAETFLNALQSSPAWREPKDPSGIASIEFGAEGRPLEDVLALVRSEVEHSGLCPASPHEMGWIPGGGVYAASLGDFVAAVGNSFSGHMPACPGAARVENRLVAWIAEMVGYPEGAGGTLASGGSIAQLTATIAARDSRGVRPADASGVSVYFTGQQHYAARKALHVAGLGEVVRREIPVDAEFRMVPEELARLASEDRARGVRPWLVISSAGTTNTGAVDPLADVSRIARELGMWHHVDAAYGGFFMLAPDLRPLFAGIESSDSAVLDPHKSLFLPYGLGAVVVRDARTLESLSFSAPYLGEDEYHESSPAEQSVELTRHFRGLRMLFPLMLHGTAPFAAALEEKSVLARYMHAELSQWPDIEVGPPPQLSTFPFRLHRPGGSAEECDDMNLALLAAIHRDGRTFLTGTWLRGRFWLRPSIGIFRTHAEHVDAALGVLKELVETLPVPDPGAPRPTLVPAPTQ